MNIYIICAWYEVGMRTYSYTVLNNIRRYMDKDHTFYITLVLKDKPENYPELANLSGMNINFVIIDNTFKNIASKIFPEIYDNYFAKKAIQYNASLTYILYEGVFFKNIKKIQQQTKVLFTIHDLIGHEKNISGWKDRWLEKTEKHRRAYLRKQSDFTLTNSTSQHTTLKVNSNNPSYYIGMPTLVNEHIGSGSSKTPELGFTGYILFFGRIDKYKGLETLINTHLKSEAKAILVIAGSGNAGFEIPETHRIIFINRYIHDNELHQLFKNALACVLPYESVTQTALISLPYYFNCPVILSTLPEFKAQAKISGSIICDFKNYSNYFHIINTIETDHVFRNDIIKSQLKFYNQYYDQEIFSNNLKQIFNEIQKIKF